MIIRCMRTTLSIDDDVLLAAKELARRDGKTAGEVISELARVGLNARDGDQTEAEGKANALGFRPFGGDGVVTNADVEAIREREGI